METIKNVLKAIKKYYIVLIICTALFLIAGIIIGLSYEKKIDSADSWCVAEGFDEVPAVDFSNKDDTLLHAAVIEDRTLRVFSVINALVNEKLLEETPEEVKLLFEELQDISYDITSEALIKALADHYASADDGKGAKDAALAFLGDILEQKPIEILAYMSYVINALDETAAETYMEGSIWNNVKFINILEESLNRISKMSDEDLYRIYKEGYELSYVSNEAYNACIRSFNEWLNEVAQDNYCNIVVTTTVNPEGTTKYGCKFYYAYNVSKLSLFWESYAIVMTLIGFVLGAYLCFALYTRPEKGNTKG